MAFARTEQQRKVRARGSELIQQAIAEVREGLNAVHRSPALAHEIYLQAARTLYIAETVEWVKRTDILRQVLEKLALELNRAGYSAHTKIQAAGRPGGRVAQKKY